MEEGVNACNKRQWNQALEHLREAISIGLDKKHHSEEAAKCYFHAAMAQMECAVTFRDWERAFFYATEPGLEKTSFALRLKELENQITSRGRHHLKPVLELMNKAQLALVAELPDKAVSFYHEAAMLGSSKGVCLEGAMRARLSTSVTACESAIAMIHRGKQMGYPHADDLLALGESKHYCLQMVKMYVAGRREEALDMLRKQACEKKDGLIGVEYARLAAKTAVSSSDWKRILSDLQYILKYQCTLADEVQDEANYIESMMEIAAASEKRNTHPYDEEFEVLMHYNKAVTLGNPLAAYLSAQYRMERAQNDCYKFTNHSDENHNNYQHRKKLLERAKAMVEKANSMGLSEAFTLLPEINYLMTRLEDEYAPYNKIIY